MDARTIDNLEAADPSAETRQLIARWRYSKTGHLQTIRWPLEEVPRAKISPERTENNTRASTISHTKSTGTATTTAGISATTTAKRTMDR